MGKNVRFLLIGVGVGAVVAVGVLGLVVLLTRPGERQTPPAPTVAAETSPPAAVKRTTPRLPRKTAAPSSLSESALAADEATGQPAPPVKAEPLTAEQQKIEDRTQAMTDAFLAALKLRSAQQQQAAAAVERYRAIAKVIASALDEADNQRARFLQQATESGLTETQALRFAEAETKKWFFAQREQCIAVCDEWIAAGEDFRPYLTREQTRFLEAALADPRTIRQQFVDGSFLSKR